jgi:hypothetical protein
MRTRLKVLCVLAFLCASAVVEGQTSWAGLAGLKVGQKIQIIEMTSKKHSGTFLSVSDSAITFTEGKAEKSIQKADVRSVKLLTHRRMRNTLIGAGVGFGALAWVGGVFGASYGTAEAATGVALLGGVGALIGAPIGALVPTQNTVYNANPH